MTMNFQAGNPHFDLGPILPILEADSRILAAYLLGSEARGQSRPDSDIDIALLIFPRAALDALECGAISGEIALATGRDVDIGRLDSSNLVYAREAILTGHRIFVRERTAADLAVTTLLGMYAWFETERREVVDAYRSR